jgi:hypothetical protein
VADSEKLVQSAVVRGPLAKNATTGQGEICLPVTTGNQTMVIPSWLAGKYCDFTAAGASVDILAGASTADVEYGAESGLAASVVTVDVNTGRRIVDGTTRSWLMPLPHEATHIAWEGSGTGKLYIGVSSREVERS